MTDTNQTASEGITITTQPLPVPLANSEQRAKEFRDQLAALNKPPVQEEIQSNKEENHEQESRIDDDISNGDDSGSDSLNYNDDNDSNDLDNVRISNTIPKKRFNKELQKRKEIEQALQEEREARIRIETQLNMFNEAAKKIQETQDEIPDITPLDDEAHAYYVKQINSLKKEFESKLQEVTATQTQTKFETTVTTQAEAFKRKHSDFDDAYKFIIDKESKNAKLMGLNDDEAFQFAMQKLHPVAWNVYNKGGNVAETIYNMAENYGYSAKGNKKGNGVNLGNISKNSKLSSSIIDDVPAAVTSMSGSSQDFLHMDGFKSLERKDGKGVDPDKFRKALYDVQTNR